MEQQILVKDTLIGERFSIEELVGKGDLGFVYKARDVKNNKLIALRVIPAESISNEADVDRLRIRVKEASTLTYRNIRATFGMGTEEDDGAIYIATEWIEGQNLRSLLFKRSQAGKRFSFKGAYNIIGHVCNALNYAHRKTFHGALSPRAIMVNNAGRVKIGDWGLSVIRTRLESYPGRKKVEGIFWAPEVLKNPNTANARSDIYALGAIFYELITGMPPKRPLKAPSQVGFSRDVDTVVARCMAADPLQRFENAAAVKNAVSSLVKKEEDLLYRNVAGSVDDNLGVDVEIDLGDSLVNAPGLPAQSSGSLGMDGDPPGKDDRVSTIDMGALLSSLGKGEAARWMVQKDKFDHGPFTDRELIQMIMTGEVLPKHNLLNTDTGVRKKVKAWGDFDKYLEQYRIKKKKMEEEAALQRTKTAEKRGTAFKVMVALIVIGVIGLGVGGYFISRELRKEKTFSKDELIAALDSGEIKLKTGGDLSGKKRRGKGKRRKGGAGDFVDGMTYEEAMAMGVEMGSLADNSGQRQLSAAVIEQIMDKNVRRFLPCMDGSANRVDMNIAVGGNGRVIGTSVKKGSSKLKKCVASKVRGIKFPTSSSPRTATSWWFEIY